MTHLWVLQLSQSDLLRLISTFTRTWNAISNSDMTAWVWPDGSPWREEVKPIYVRDNAREDCMMPFGMLPAHKQKHKQNYRAAELKELTHYQNLSHKGCEIWNIVKSKTRFLFWRANLLWKLKVDSLDKPPCKNGKMTTETNKKKHLSVFILETTAWIWGYIN